MNVFGSEPSAYALWHKNVLVETVTRAEFAPEYCKLFQKL